MVPFCVVLTCLALLRLARPVVGQDRGVVLLLSHLVTCLLTAAFYLLVIQSYRRRGPARATSRVPLALLAGPVATFLPFLLPLAADGRARSGPALLLGDGLLATGLCFSSWSLRCLGRSLSVVPQARVLVSAGPYAHVRHPLYLGELVAMLGLALTLGGTWPLALWSLLVVLQGYRAVQEEHLLERALPGYRDYRDRTARLVPAIF